MNKIRKSLLFLLLGIGLISCQNTPEPQIYATQVLDPIVTDPSSAAAYTIHSLEDRILYYVVSSYSKPSIQEAQKKVDINEEFLRSQQVCEEDEILELLEVRHKQDGDTHYIDKLFDCRK